MSLMGRRIALTRPQGLNDAWQQALVEQGAEGVCYPLLRLEPSDTPAPAELAAADGLIFISPSAVQFSLPILTQGQLPRPTQTIAAMGQGTAHALLQHGVVAGVCPPGVGDSQQLLDLLPDIAGQRWVLIQGEGGRDLLPSELRARGAEPVVWPVYRRVADTVSLQQLLCDLEALDAIALTSSETARLLFAHAGESQIQRLQSKPIVVLHPRIAEIARVLGAKHILLAESTGALTQVLTDFFGR